MPLYPNRTWTSANSTSPSTTGTSGGDISKDVTIANGPGDSISELAWSSQANHLAVSSWDSKVRVYDCTQAPTGNGVAMIEFEKPTLTCDWSKDGTKVVGAGLDHTARLLDLGNGGGAAAQQVAAHDAPIKSARFFKIPNSASPMLATASWDKTIRYWDLRLATPAASVTLSERIYSMDLEGSLLVATTADRKVHVIKLSNPTSATSVESNMEKQLRVVTCMPDASGYGLGGVEGRCAIRFVEQKDQSKDFQFKCHREQDATKTKTDIYAVNAMSWHPSNHEVFSTAGSDGLFSFWHRSSRCRTKAFPSVGGAITSTSFNRDGSLFAYGVSYDWSKGFAHNNPQYPIMIAVHKVDESEMKAPKNARRY